MEAGREMDAAIAELMGLKVYKVANHAKFKEAPLTYHWYCEDSDGITTVPKHYSTDIAMTYQMEERIAELGLIGKYCKYLNDIANARWDAGEKLGRSWQLIHASPDDRCRAALLTLVDSERDE